MHQHISGSKSYANVKYDMVIRSLIFSFFYFPSYLMIVFFSIRLIALLFNKCIQMIEFGEEPAFTDLVQIDGSFVDKRAKIIKEVGSYSVNHIIFV